MKKLSKKVLTVMHLDELIYQLEELRSKYEDLHVYIDGPDYGWELFSVEVIRKGINDGISMTEPEGEIWVGLR